MMEAMIPSQVGMGLRTLQKIKEAKEAHKKIGVPTKPMVEEPPKIYHTTEAFYFDHLRSLCARAETPTSLEHCPM